MIIIMGLQNDNWLAAVLAGVALAMGILPEEYPVVLTIFPAMGAQRLAKQGVITRKMTAIETLGAISVLCTDKTGTLTAGVVALDGALDTQGVASARVLRAPYWPTSGSRRRMS